MLNKGTVLKVLVDFKTSSQTFKVGQSFLVEIAADSYNAIMWKIGKKGEVLSKNNLSNSKFLNNKNAYVLLEKGYIELTSEVGV